MGTSLYQTNPRLRQAKGLFPDMSVLGDFLLQETPVYDINVAEERFPSKNERIFSDTLSIRKRDLFFCAGLLSTPSTSGRLKSWGFFMEHADSLRESSGHLRVISEAEKWDSRIKGLFSERLAIGISGWLLWNKYNVTHIADAERFIGKELQNEHSPYDGSKLKKLNLYGKNGGYKPDFFCLSSQDECVIAESKGKINVPSTINKDKAKKQVKNVTPKGIDLRSDNNRLAFASHFRREDESVNKDSGTTVVDPEEDNESIAIPVDSDTQVLQAYVKLLNFCGLDNFSRVLNARNHQIFSEDIIDELSLEFKNTHIFPLLYIRQDSGVIGIVTPVAKEIFLETDGSLTARINEKLDNVEFIRKEHGSSQERYLLLPNGIFLGSEEILKRN